MKRVAVIGAGVSGMTAAVYCLKSGLDVTVYEKHFKSGGLCSGWKRNGYSFEGAVHWLNDSHPDDPMYRLWRDTGILGDGIEVFRSDPYLVYTHNGTKISICRDIEKLRNHLLEISPGDKKAIEALCRDIRIISRIRIPIIDIPGLKTRNKSRLDLPLLLGMVPALPAMERLSGISIKEYASVFKHPGIRKVFGEIIMYDQYNAMSLVHTMACYCDSGVYPKGGSLELGKRMEDKIKSMGGRIVFNTKVDRVFCEDGKARFHARGVEINGEKIPYDAVVVTQDISTIENLLGRQPKDKWIKEALNAPLVQSTFIAIGVRDYLGDLPHAMAFDETISAGGIRYNSILLTNYAEYPDYAPPGCTSLACKFNGESYEYWKEHKINGTYNEEKQRLSNELKLLIEKAIPRIKGKIEVINIATPLTYERYTGTQNGTWATVMLKNKHTGIPKSVSSAFKFLYFAGFRTKVPGGLPIAALSGFRAAQYVCRDLGAVFEGANY